MVSEPPPLIGVGWRHVIQRLVQAPMVAVIDESGDGPFQSPRAVVLLELDHVLHRAVIAFDLALRHRVIRCPTCVRDLVGLQIVRQLP